MEMVETRSNSDDIAATLDKIAAKLDAIGSFKEDIAFLKRLAASREKAHSEEHRSEEKEDLNGDGSGCTNSDITSETNACDNFRIYDFKDGTSDDVKKIVSTLNSGQVSSPDVVEVVVSSPFVFLPYVKSELQPEFQVAAQICWVEKGGAFTDGVSAEMLVNLVIPWVILGHSERRALLNETNEFVGDKVAYALSQCLKVIACVGKALEQREAGTTMEVVAAQTKVIADKISSWDNVVTYPTPPWIVFIHFDLRTSRFTKGEVLIRFRCKCIPAERKGIQVTNIWEVCWLKLGQSYVPHVILTFQNMTGSYG